METNPTAMAPVMEGIVPNREAGVVILYRSINLVGLYYRNYIGWKGWHEQSGRA